MKVSHSLRLPGSELVQRLSALAGGIVYSEWLHCLACAARKVRELEGARQTGVTKTYQDGRLTGKTKHYAGDPS